jgi:two-component system response regulator AtoC
MDATDRTVLIVDDEPSLRHMLSTALGHEGYRPETAATAAEALEMLQKTRYRTILCDIRLPDESGLDLLAKIRELDHHAIVIMISAYGSVDTAMEAVRRGAHDYLSKPFSPEEILLRMKKAEEGERLKEDNIRLRREVERRYSFHRIVGKSDVMQALFDKVRKVAATKATILIHGESGTGKELFARAIHYTSPRRGGPFVAINCGAIPENLLESELFGHVKGAFTGAVGHKRGLFEEAGGGTILLDEIGELPLPLQVKLLRVLQEEEIRKVGDTRTQKTDVRVIAATARLLEDEVAEGTFREDLFYRINVITLDIPPLRERREDIPMLAEHYLAECTARAGDLVREFSPEALQAIMNYPWPGNVRELVNAVERAVILAEGEKVQPADLPAAVAGARDAPPVFGEEGLNLKRNRAALERRLIKEALRQSVGNRSKTAALLGIGLRNLMYKLKEYGLRSEG